MTPKQRAAALRLVRTPISQGDPVWHNEAVALLRELAADPVVNQSLTTEPQGEPVARPPTPPGWSDTDWLRHLESCLPIGYAVRDHLYGTSKAGVLRLCSSTEAGAFAIYAAPQQRQPLTRGAIVGMWGDRSDGPENAEIISFARAVERAHGIGGEE